MHISSYRIPSLVTLVRREELPDQSTKMIVSAEEHSDRRDVMPGLLEWTTVLITVLASCG